MSEIHYSDGDDFIDLSLLTGNQRRSSIYADGGDDTVVGAASFVGTVISGPGNDVISHADVAYYDDPEGVTVNLRTGTASDGFGGHDVLSDVVSIHAGAWDDKLFGSARSEWFAGNGGSDTINGGAGEDTAYFEGTQSDYTFAFSEDRQTLFVNSGSGALDALANVEYLEFESDGASTSVSSLRYAVTGTPFFKQNAWIPDSSLPAVINGLNVGQVWSPATAIGDFTGDGKLDIVIAASEFVYPTDGVTDDGVIA